MLTSWLHGDWSRDVFLFQQQITSKNMNTQNLTTPEKEIYQQPMLKVITIQTSRCILVESGTTETSGAFDDVQ